MKPYTVFIVDDEEMIREGIALALKKDYQIQAFESAEMAIKAIKRESPDLVLLDIGLGGMNGVEALKKIKELNSEILVIMVTAYEDVDTVVSSMKLGAYDYAVKPVHIETLLKSINNALETVKMRKEIKTLQEACLRENQPWFIGESDTMQDVMDMVKKVAKSPDTPILIQGDTGTGKELIANAIHFRSPNFKEPFIAINCASFPKDLLESELFGYEKGAFSGANPEGKKGLVEEAENGTLFLDEISNLSPEAQVKLLRFLESGEFYKIGSTKKLSPKVRIISAANKDLEQMISDDLFRRDLFYRLAVVKVTVPSMNERPDDIIPIAQYYLIEFAKKFGKKFNSIAPEAEKALLKYNWKGNVRELKNVIERSVLISEGPELKASDIGLENIYTNTDYEEGTKGTVSIPEIGIDFPSHMETIEKQFFIEALRITKNNESKAAKLLSLSRDTFRYRRKKINLN